MTQSQHTPGPWVIKTRTVETPNLPVKSYEKMGVFAASQTDQMTGEGVRIADLAYCCPTFTEIEANAHLIAAAPDMLEALENLRIQLADIVENELPALLHDGPTSELLLSRLDSYTGKIAEVITKAKGEQ